MDILEADRLGKRYGRRWALEDCTLAVPSGRVVGLVGPNGAGKTTLLHLAVGLLSPTSGAISVLGERPAAGPAQLERVGFVAEDTPTYRSMSVDDHLRLGSWLNPRWDAELAERRIDALGVDRSQRAGSLSGGQRAQLALTLAVAKRPDLLILDEPVASLDPLARREFLAGLAEIVAERGMSVIFSSHLVEDVERVCDHLVVLVGSRVQVAGDIRELLAAHGLDGPGALEELVLSYMRGANPPGGVVIRLVWRQFRVPAIAGAAALVVVAAIVLLTHPHLADVYDSTVRGCDDRGTCDADGSVFLQVHEAVGGWLGILTVVVPGLIGVFWGAPLVAREIEQGTFRLVWTQSVTRSRWLAVQLAVVGLASVVVAGLISLMVTWWSGLHDGVRDDAFRMFDQRDVVPFGYAAVAFTLGAAIGVFVRRVMPAIATTLVTFIAVRFAVTHWIRPALLSPRTMTAAIDPDRTGFGSHDGEPMTLMPEPPHLPNVWVRSVEVVDDSGTRLTAGALRKLCPDIETTLGPPPSGSGGFERHGPAPGEVVDVLHDCIATVGRRYHVLTTYHPARSYWTFQWLELGVYLGIAAVLAAACFWGSAVCGEQATDPPVVGGWVGGVNGRIRGPS